MPETKNLTDPEDDRQAIDSSIKSLFREMPHLAFRLRGSQIRASDIRVEDANLNQPELRADHVFITRDPNREGERALYLEYMLRPNEEDLANWCAKWGALKRRLRMPVVLMVIYIEKGDRATFPDGVIDEIDDLSTRFLFETVRLWEHADRIRSGELAELAPLLVLCESSPTLATVREEIGLILHTPMPQEARADLLSLALRVAGKRLPRDLVAPLFREEFTMVRDPVIQEILDSWEAKGRDEGLKEGLKEGQTSEARELALVALRGRFGDIPESWEIRVQGADIAWCRRVLPLTYRSTDLADLDRLLAEETIVEKP